MIPPSDRDSSNIEYRNDSGLVYTMTRYLNVILAGQSSR